MRNVSIGFCRLTLSASRRESSLAAPKLGSSARRNRFRSGATPEERSNCGHDTGLGSRKFARPTCGIRVTLRPPQQRFRRRALCYPGLVTAGVAQLVERRSVAPNVVGSIPTTRPITSFIVSRLQRQNILTINDCAIVLPTSQISTARSSAASLAQPTMATLMN
jgi:hypothetical protein